MNSTFVFYENNFVKIFFGGFKKFLSENNCQKSLSLKSGLVIDELKISLLKNISTDLIFLICKIFRRAIENHLLRNGFSTQ